MKVSEQWLRTYTRSKASMAELADQLTQVGIEVDALAFEIGEGGIQEGVMTLKIPPNRGDCCSMEGIARELAAIHHQPYHPPEAGVKQEPFCLGSLTTETLSVRIDAPERCPRYLGCLITGVNTQAISPVWLQVRLALAGMNSVSIVVDSLNYVMLELGQPLHAFDANTLGAAVVVRHARSGESITLLDGRTVELDAETLIIADAEKPQAIAGIMGGLASSVTNNTRDIFIESAYFDPISIRLAGQRFGLRTEASSRFERGVDPNLARRALERAATLISSIAGGTLVGVVEKEAQTYLPSIPRIFLRKKRIQAILGVTLPENEMIDILRRLSMRVEIESEGFQVEPPSFRHDICQEIDLIEEIARLYGLHRLPSETLKGDRVSFSIPETHIPVSRVRQLLVDRGFYEAITYSFTDPKSMSLFEFPNQPLPLTNPISTDMAVMRISLWPGLLQVVQYNQNRQRTRGRFFEIGACFLPQEEGVIEKTLLAGICAGPLYTEQWGLSTRNHDYYDVKQEVETLCLLTGMRCRFERAAHPALHPGQSAKITVNESTIGYLGALHPKIVKAFALEGPVFVFELELAKIQETQKIQCQALSKFPTVRRDIAVVVNKTVSVGELVAALSQSAGAWLQEAMVFDVYEGKGIDANKKSVAMGLILQHPLRTLEILEVNRIIQEVVAMLMTRFDAVLRE